MIEPTVVNKYEPSIGDLVEFESDNTMHDTGRICALFYMDSNPMALVSLTEPFWDEKHRHYVTLLVVHQSNLKEIQTTINTLRDRSRYPASTDTRVALHPNSHFTYACHVNEHAKCLNPHCECGCHVTKHPFEKLGEN